jgi:hypothetical protein
MLSQPCEVESVPVVSVPKASSAFSNSEIPTPQEVVAAPRPDPWQHDATPGHRGWIPGARHVRRGGAMAFDHRCKLCKYELEDFVIRHRPPSQSVLVYLRNLAEEA